MKIKKHYRDKAAQDNQEVVTPPELVDRIYNKLLEIYPDIFDNNPKILDPCVGPGALIQPLLDMDNINLTVSDIQEIHAKKWAEEFGVEIQSNSQKEFEIW